MAALAMSAVSRREFVLGLLGAPASLASCRAPANTALPDGELLLPGKAAGHRLREMPAGDGLRPERFERARVVIVGGGAAGLSAAWWLERAGLRDVLVLELDAVAGGTSRSGSSPLTRYPWGAHYIVAPLPEQRNLIALLGEMGQLEAADSFRASPGGEGDAGHPALQHDQLPATGSSAVAEFALCREPEERVFYRGRWYGGLYLHAGADETDRAELSRFQSEIARWVGFRDAVGRRAFVLPTGAGSDADEVRALDRESFASWLERQGLRSPRLRWLADYACRDDYGLLAADTSAWAGIGYFASRIAQPGAEAQPVVTWPEGNGRITDFLSARLGLRVRRDHAVHGMRVSDSGVQLAVRTADGVVGFEAERVILATPHFINRRLLPALGARAQPELDRGAWAVANLHLAARPRSRPEDAPLAWDNVLYDSPSLGYVVATHQSGRDHGPTVLTWYYPFTGSGPEARAQLDGASREDWAALAIADLERAHPGLGADCQRIDVAYWGHGMVRPRVGSVFQPALRSAREPLGPVHFAASELSGLALFEEALDHGVRAAGEVLSALGWRA